VPSKPPEEEDSLCQAWEQRLKAEGLGRIPLSERHWNSVTQKTCRVLSIETNLDHLDDPDTDRLLPAVDPFQDPAPGLEELIDAIPLHIADILRMDHRRRTRREQQRLKDWLEGEGRRLKRHFGFM
jgi:hypothetical protein